MTKARVFISFDYDNDKSLKDILVLQARIFESPFEISDWSLKESQPESEWEEKAMEKIKKVGIFCVIAGTQTYLSSGVKKEIVIVDTLKSYGYDIDKFELIGHSDEKCPHVEGSGIRIAWTWENLKKYFSK